jgi:hypothetical protein
LLKRLSSTGATVFVALLHDPSQGLVQTSGVFMSTTADEWEQMSRQAQRHNEIIKAAATKYGAALVDIPATKIFTTLALMYEDGIIPTRGYDELAKKVGTYFSYGRHADSMTVVSVSRCLRRSAYSRFIHT